MNLFRHRTIPSGSLVRESVFQRSNNYASRIPSALVMVKAICRFAASSSVGVS
jgi:hypothetical protein